MEPRESSDFIGHIQDISQRRDYGHESLPRIFNLSTSSYMHTAVRLGAPDLTPEMTGYAVAAEYDYSLATQKDGAYRSLHSAISRTRRHTPPIFEQPTTTPDYEYEPDEEVY